MSGFESSYREIFELFERPPKTLAYGTAGFRANVNLPLNAVFHRMGLLAALRSRSVGNKPIGVMITASHNPECDNGLKIVDYNGGMMTQSWEPFAERIVNAASASEGIAVISEILATISVVAEGSSPVIIIGRDTRPHSFELFENCKLGATIAGCTVYDIGEVTTPQLHFVVHHLHTKHHGIEVTQESVDAALKAYPYTIAEGFSMLASTAGNDFRVGRCIIDCSFGVGSIGVQGVDSVLRGMNNNLQLELRNIARDGKVNEGCGAELVQKSVVPPINVNEADDINVLLCSYDGDADRIVFHSFLKTSADVPTKWVLMDGDKIAAIAASLIHSELIHAGLKDHFSIGVVQSAYANGASTHYFRSQSIPVVMAKTGVKYMHHKAEAFDIGIYFEANGHGTVLFSNQFVAFIHAKLSSMTANLDNREYCALTRLSACTKVINAAVGDAISDMYLVLACLQVLQMDITAWNNLYSDLPSKMIKFPVADKNKIICNEDETRALEPVGLQQLLDDAMSTVPMGRCFVRPSGTEDVVRVYAEAVDADGVNRLIDLAVQAINACIH